MTTTQPTTTAENSGRTSNDGTGRRGDIENEIVWSGYGVPADLIHANGRIVDAQINVWKRAVRIGTSSDLIEKMMPTGARLVAYKTGLSPEARAALNVLAKEGLIRQVR